MKKTIYFFVLATMFTIIWWLYLKSVYAYEDDVFEDIEQVDFDSGVEAGDDGEEVHDDESAKGVVEMKAEFLDGDILKISVWARAIQNPVLGVSFNLKYEAEKLAFLRYDPGDFLERGGDPFYLVKNSNSRAAIIFGETLKQKDSFPIGEGKLTDLYFQVLQRSGLEFKFEKGVVSGMDSIRQDLDKIDWKDLSLGKNGGKILDENSQVTKSPEANSFNLMYFSGGVLAGFALIVVLLLIYKKRRIHTPKPSRFNTQ